MNNESLAHIFINSSLINNFVLAYFLGICPFLGVSGRMDTAVKMGAAVTFVMLVSSLCAFGLHLLLTIVQARYLELISFIVVIASAVQFVEMLVKKTIPALFKSLGIFLPLITTNCAILGMALFQTARDYNMVQGMIFALGAGGGFTLALVLMAGIRQQMDVSSIPDVARGTVLALLTAGVLSLAFMGFSGLTI